jgi:hypothetical protein
MIIHHKDNFAKYTVICQKPLKYIDDFSFIPIKIVNSEDTRDPCIFQTPLLFSPYGIQTNHNKTTIDLSFMNRENDPTLETFYNHLLNIYGIIRKRYGRKYHVNPFLKTTMFNECLRLKVTDRMTVFDQNKQSLQTIPSFSYGNFLINLHGLWISDKEIWFQWYLVQAKIIEPVSLQDYLFIDDNEPGTLSAPNPSSATSETQEHQAPDKYDKMLKMGVPKDAVDRQRQMDMAVAPKRAITPSSVPKPPPLPVPSSSASSSSSSSAPASSTTVKIEAKDLLGVKLKSSSTRVLSEKMIETTDNQEMGYFEPPSLGDIQSMLRQLKPVPQ